VTGSNDHATADLRCVELVEMVTSYLEHALPDDVRAAIDSHLVGCQGCRQTLKQWRTVIDLSGRLTVSDIAQVDANTREKLKATFHRLRPR
jgi:anti-sigma factor RsiW